MRVGLIGVPYSSTGRQDGEARAPRALRAAGLVTTLQRVVDLVDYGDVAFGGLTTTRDPASGIIAPAALDAMVTAVRAMVGRVLADDRLPLVVGGECPLLLGCLAAARDRLPRVGLLFVDGHEDAWPPAQSTTGEAADMELGFALGLTRPQGLPALDALLPLVQPADTVVLGPRDDAELTAANLPSVAALTTFRDDSALRRQPGAAAHAGVARLAAAGPWWFHLDFDVLATAALPAVRYPQAGGLTWGDLDAVTAAALAVPGLIGWNVTIYNPDRDDGTGATRIVTFLGEHLRPMAELAKPEAG